MRAGGGKGQRDSNERNELGGSSETHLGLFGLNVDRSERLEGSEEEERVVQCLARSREER